MKLNIKKIFLSLALTFFSQQVTPCTNTHQHGFDCIVIAHIKDAATLKDEVHTVIAQLQGLNTVKLGMHLSTTTGFNYDDLFLFSDLQSPIFNIIWGIADYAAWLLETNNPIVSRLKPEDKKLAFDAVSNLQEMLAKQTNAPLEPASASEISDLFTQIASQLTYIHSKAVANADPIILEKISVKGSELAETAEAYGINGSDLLNFIVKRLSKKDIETLKRFFEQNLHVKIETYASQIYEALRCTLKPAIMKKLLNLQNKGASILREILKACIN